MQMHQLKRKTAQKAKRVVGRGGKRGTTAGKGTKGQKSRAGHRMRPELRDIIKKLPKQRGRGMNLNVSIQDKPAVVNLGAIEKAFASGETVSPESLASKGLINSRGGKNPAVKVLATGTITKKVAVTGCQVSETAKAQIEKVGGSVAA